MLLLKKTLTIGENIEQGKGALGVLGGGAAGVSHGLPTPGLAEKVMCEPE